MLGSLLMHQRLHCQDINEVGYEVSTSYNDTLLIVQTKWCYEWGSGETLLIKLEDLRIWHGMILLDI